MKLPSLAVYVHVPWCVRKCPYCDFNSHAADPDAIPEADYLARLFDDLDQDLPLAQGRRIDSLFFGGGTPSLLSDGAIAAILERLEQRIGFVDNAEITLEANPGTLDESRYRGYRQAGVNRLSIGVQSFHEAQLQRLGRIHTSKQANLAMDAARAAGFERVNLDLMHGLPDQTPDEALADLDQAIALSPEHISWYQLTIEPNTAFYNSPPALPEDEALWAIAESGQAHLVQAGYQQYEVSAYAQPGEACRHNLNYWGYGDYLGLGPGAHGKITLVEQNRLVRTRKTRLPRDYLNTSRLLVRHEEDVAEVDRPFDYFINSLRLTDGMPLEHFSQATGLPLSSIEERLNSLVNQGLLEFDHQRLRTTARGFLYLNDILSEWLA